MEWIKSPWPWYVGGPLITFIMVLMLFFGKSFGISSTLKTVCSIGGAGKFSEFFKFEWKEQVWNLFFRGWSFNWWLYCFALHDRPPGHRIKSRNHRSIDFLRE